MSFFVSVILQYLDLDIMDASFMNKCTTNGASICVYTRLVVLLERTCRKGKSQQRLTVIWGFQGKVIIQVHSLLNSITNTVLGNFISWL
jgi:hypothetical protein